MMRVDDRMVTVPGYRKVRTDAINIVNKYRYEHEQKYGFGTFYNHPSGINIETLRGRIAN